MNNIGEIVFASLAARKAIYLPELGMLRVVTSPANFSAGKSVAPRNSVVFTLIQAEEDSNVTLRLVADEDYISWLSTSRATGVIDLGLAGRIENDIFTPSAQLDALLNPAPVLTIKKARKRSSTGPVWWGISIAALLLLVTGIFWWSEERGFQSERSIGGIRNATVVSQSGLDRVAASSANNDIPENDLSDKVISGDTAAVQEPRADTDGLSDASVKSHETVREPQEEVGAVADTNNVHESRSVRGVYHVVGGVFSVEENADKYINNLKRRFPDLELSYTKLPFKNGKTLVSLYSANDEQSVESRRGVIARQISVPDVWVYKAE